MLSSFDLTSSKYYSAKVDAQNCFAQCKRGNAVQKSEIRTKNSHFSSDSTYNDGVVPVNCLNEV